MKFIKFLFIIFITLSSTLKAELNENLIKELKVGNKLIFIRHAYAPGIGDPINFDINDCSSQRNLNSKGREQARNIGFFFTKNQIPIYKVISSEWCRCKETALLGFGNFETKKFLNSFFSSKFAENKGPQIKKLKEFINNWDGKNNVIFVTHYVVISEILNYASSSGEIVITDKSLKVIDTIEIEY